MALKSPYLGHRPRLELTSLMDVMFLVLVFFVYSIFSMAVHKGVKVDLPTASGTLEKGERLVVTIDAKDALQLNGRPLNQEDLIREAHRLVSAKPDVPVLISGDRHSSLGMGVELLAALKSVGVEKISFQVSGANVKTEVTTSSETK